MTPSHRYGITMPRQALVLGYRICPVTKSTSMTSCRATNSGVTQSFFSPAPGATARRPSRL